MGFDALLAGFENVLWYISLGLLISGGILVILSFIFNIESFSHAFGGGDHDLSVDHDISVDHDLSVDHDIGVDHDLSVDHDIGVDHDLSVDHDAVTEHSFEVKSDSTHVELDGLKDATHSSAPIFLLLSTYFLMFGILGVSTLRIFSDSLGLRIFRVLIVIIAPFILALGITNIWKRISSTTTSPIKSGNQLIGMEGIVYVPVDSKGGTIHVDLGEGLGIQKLPAKSFNYFDRFERDDKIRIVAIKDGCYLIDKF